MTTPRSKKVNGAHYFYCQSLEEMKTTARKYHTFGNLKEIKDSEMESFVFIKKGWYRFDREIACEPILVPLGPLFRYLIRAEHVDVSLLRAQKTVKKAKREAVEADRELFYARMNISDLTALKAKKP